MPAVRRAAGLRRGVQPLSDLRLLGLFHVGAAVDSMRQRHMVMMRFDVDSTCFACLRILGLIANRGAGFQWAPLFRLIYGR